MDAPREKASRIFYCGYLLYDQSAPSISVYLCPSRSARREQSMRTGLHRELFGPNRKPMRSLRLGEIIAIETLPKSKPVPD